MSKAEFAVGRRLALRAQQIIDRGQQVEFTILGVDHTVEARAVSVSDVIGDDGYIAIINTGSEELHVSTTKIVGFTTAAR